MVNSKLDQLKEKLQQTLEQMGETLDQWLNKRRLAPRPIPIPGNRRTPGRR